MIRFLAFCSIGLLPVYSIHGAPIGPCPAVLNPATNLTSNGCASIITVNANSTISIATTGQPPFDNDNPNDGPPPLGTGGDFLIGVVNNSLTPLLKLSLTGKNGLGYDFDENVFRDPKNNNILTQTNDRTAPGAVAINDHTGVAIITTGTTTAMVNFTTPVGAGKSTYFAIEGLPDPVVPEPGTVGLMGSALIILIVKRGRKSRS